ncbi:TetR/AcrR family transcriptional regulator [Novosphingobium sp.]|uniref:TetR/AcrR family transcriptional regulator n=1 Tax=Novosphingobium sp. TaxID=1874826 RepID=UPI0035B4EC2E
MVTVSTSPLAARTYHHGDLRSALVEAGLKALETTEIEDLSLRQLARDVGVSATAVYRHFPDKRALFSALADAGIERLFHAQEAAAEAAAPNESFAATGRAYVRFALANPALFRLTFAYSCRSGPTVFGNSRAALMLQDYAARIAPDPEDARTLVMQAWSLVHGLAMLMLDGQLPPEDALIDRVIDTNSLFGR